MATSSKCDPTKPAPPADAELHRGDQLRSASTSSCSGSARLSEGLDDAVEQRVDPLRRAAPRWRRLAAPLAFSSFLISAERSFASRRSALLSAITSAFSEGRRHILDLAANNAPGLDRVLGIGRNEVQQQARALHMSKERSPMPAPSAAPSIRPGMSASTNSRPL